MWLLQHYRRLVALLRSTLQRQLSELTAIAPLRADFATASDPRKLLQQLHVQSQDCMVACSSAVRTLHDSRRKLRHAQDCLSWLDRDSVQRSVAAIRAARLEADAPVQERRATELLLHFQHLTKRVLGMQSGRAELQECGCGLASAGLCCGEIRQGT